MNGASGAVVGQRVRFRSASNAAFLLVLAMCGLLIALLETQKGDQVAAVVAGVFALCMIVLQGLGIRAGISADASGVTVVSGFGRSHHVPWPEVSAIKYMHRTGRGLSYTVRIHRTDGKVLSTSWCTYPVMSRKTDSKTRLKVEAIVATLNSARPH